MPFHPINLQASDSSSPRTDARPAEIHSPPPRRRPSPPGATPAAGIAPGEPGQQQHAPATTKSHKRRPAREKRQPTGDYERGYCRPPVEHQFKGKPGPGRPKGSLSHDTIVRRHYDQKRKIKVDGKEELVPVRELFVMTRVKHALEGKLAPLKEALAESARLYPDPQIAPAANDPTELSAAEQEMINALVADYLTRPNGDAP